MLGGVWPDPPVGPTRGRKKPWSYEGYSYIILDRTGDLTAALLFCFSIDCFYNDMDKSVINVWPIVLDPSDFSLLLNPDANSDYFFNDGLGGGITSDLTITTQAQPYLVERSIFVPYVTLSIFSSPAMINMLGNVHYALLPIAVKIC